MDGAGRPGRRHEQSPTRAALTGFDQPTLSITPVYSRLMVLLQKLKALLGLGDSEAEDREVGVTVERNGPADETTGTAEPAQDEPGEESVGIDETESAAEPGTDAEPAEGSAAADDGEPADSTGSITEPADSPEEATEPAETTGPSDGDAVPESEVSTETESDEPVDTIKGIGPAYAERLGEAGVETVGELATADAEDLAGETGIAPTRIQGWIDRAKSR